jgi:DNA-binding NarL/FixJ family response regulator
LAVVDLLVALSMYSDELHVVEALRAEAIGYIIKGASPETTLVALHEALAGRRYLSPPLTNQIIETYAAPPRHSATQSRPLRPADQPRARDP